MSAVDFSRSFYYPSKILAKIVLGFCYSQNSLRRAFIILFFPNWSTTGKILTNCLLAIIILLLRGG